MIHVIVFGVLIVGSLSITSMAAAQGGRPKGGEKDKPAAASVSLTFSDADRRVIAEYFAAHPQTVKPLPPGIAKNVARGKPLPRGIAKTRMPEDLITRLAPRPGLEISIVGDRIVLLEASGLIVDVLEEIFK